MTSRYTGTTQWLVRGDDAAGRALVPQARVFLGWLFDQIRFSPGGHGIRTGTWRGAGWTISAIARVDRRGIRLAHCVIEVLAQGVAATVVRSTLYLMMQHGLECLSLADLVLDPTGTESAVYPGDTLDAFYSGGGWSVPGSETFTHLVGLLRATSDGATPPAWVYDWPREGASPPAVADPPALTDGAHAGLHGAGAANLVYLAAPQESGSYLPTTNPGSYTGLARALIQAWRGAGLTTQSIIERLPAGWSDVPGTLGLFYDTIGKTYWIANASIAGLMVCRMAPSDASAGVKAWIDASSVTGLEADLARPYVLADLRPSGIPLTLIDAVAMAPAYAGQGTTVAEETTVWMDDAIPAGASSAVYPAGADQWSWVSSPTPHLGTYCHLSKNTAGYHQHYFWNATAGLMLGATDYFYCWVYIPSGSPPREIMIDIYTTGWLYSAYWGEDLITTGTTRVYIGAVPSERNQWVKLVFPVAYFAEGMTIKGLSFSLYDGAIAWDDCGKVTLGDNYATGDAWSVQSGWAFSPTACAIVNHRIVNQETYWDAYESALSQVAITFDEETGEPSATLTIGSWSRYRPYWAYHKLWYGAAEALQLLRNGQIWPGNADCASSAPIVCWYDDAGSLKEWCYWKAEIVSAATSYNTTYQCSCSGSGSQITYSANLKMLRGGFGLEAPEAAVVGSGTITQWEGSLTVGSAGEWFQIGGDSGIVNFTYWHSGPSNGGCGDNVTQTMLSDEYWAWRYLYPSPPWNLNAHSNTWQRNTTGSGVGVITTTTLANGGMSQTCVYLADAPDNLWNRLVLTADSKSVQVDTYTRDGIVLEQEIKQDYVVTNAETGQTVFWEGQVYAGQPTHCFGGNNPQPCGSGIWNPDIVGICSEHEPSSSSISGDYEFAGLFYVSGSTIEIDGAAASWNGALQGNGLEPAQVEMEAMRSAGGALLYTPTPSADVEALNWPSGVPALANNDSVGKSIQFVGAS